MAKLRGIALPALILFLVGCEGSSEPAADEQLADASDPAMEAADGGSSPSDDPPPSGDGSAPPPHDASAAGDVSALDGSHPGADAGDEQARCVPAGAGNPIVEGWYADPDMKVYDGVFWVYPTYSAPYEQQTHLDAFSSSDLVHWQKHDRVLDRADVPWATRAIWAPSPIRRNGKYYLYFGANDIQDDNQLGGIGVAVADLPAGPYVDAIGAPLIGKFHNGAQPIDQNVFIDDDGQAYLYYGGWQHCNIVKLNADMISLGSHDDGSVYKEITPAGYVEGALMFKRGGRYYFMWSEGGWTGPDYRVSYAIADSPLGPFATRGTILGQNAAIATGSGHNTVVNLPGTDDWYIFYHRRPLGETDGNHRMLSYDRLVFNADGSIAPVEMTSQDDFCDDNAIGWRTHGGSWSVREQSYEVAVVDEAKAVLNTNFSALDYQAVISAGSSGRAGLLFRATQLSSARHGYRGYYAGIDIRLGSLFVGRSDGGSFTELSSMDYALAPQTPTWLRVVASGSQVSVYVNGSSSPSLSVTDGSYGAGATGVIAQDADARFDDVVARPAPGVIVYQDSSYGGLGVSVAPGEYPVIDSAGVPNDWLSSLRVPAGFRVEIYEHGAFGGASWTFTADTPLMPDASNDAASSLKVFAP